MKKFLSKNDEENVIVHAIFKNIPGEICECVGVLMEEKMDGVTIAFSAIEDRVMDTIDISASDLISLDVIDEKSISVVS